MAKAQILKDEINYLLFNEVYLRFDDPKTKRKAFTILEATIQRLSTKGFDGITSQIIAKEAGVAKSVIFHYFEDLDDLMETAIKYIRLRFQKLVVDAMVGSKGEDEMLGRYVDSCFNWVENSRTHAVVWLGFVQMCVRKPRFRSLNTQAVEIGEERIRKLLSAGKASGRFKIESAEETAISIQSFVTGAMIVSASQDLRDIAKFHSTIRRQCLAMAGAH